MGWPRRADHARTGCVLRRLDGPLPRRPPDRALVDLIEVVSEEPHHHAAASDVVRRAFAQSDLGHHGEAELVERLRSRKGATSLVALDGAAVVGHILFSAATIDGLIGSALGPMAVAPSHQGIGIGSQLVQGGLDAVAGPFVVVIGHPEYYPRFGFVPARTRGVVHGFEGIPQDALFVRGERVPSGRVLYDDVFGPQFRD